VLERDRRLALADQLGVEQIERLEQRHVLVGLQRVLLESRVGVAGAVLPPDSELHAHYL